MPIMEKIQAGAAPGKKNRAARVSRSRLPLKRTINLAQTVQKRINWFTATIYIVLIVLAAVAFGKFAVADRFSEVYTARAEVRQLQEQLDNTQAAIKKYGELNARYAHYTISDMKEEELSRVNRVEILHLLRRRVLPSMAVDSWAVSGNTLTLSVSGNTLQEINLMMQTFLKDDIVDYCTVTTAETGKETDAQDGAVSAVLIVYLKSENKEANRE